MAGRSQRIWSAVFAVLVVVGGLAVTGGPASAVVTTTTNNIVKISPPADVRPAGLCSQTSVYAFNELQGVTLAAPVKVNFTDPGSYAAWPAVSPKIPAGTVVDSHFLDSGSCGGATWREGTIKFSQDILGVIVHRDMLANSDYLGSPTTEYGGAYPSREYDWATNGTSDFVQIVDARTIYVKVSTGGNTDQMRILTKHNVEPTPNAGGPYAGNEGSAVGLSGSATDPDGDPITKSWTFTWSASPGTVCTSTGTTTYTPTITCNDDALVTATLSVTDGYHPPVTSVANVTISNRPPTITSVTVPAGPVALGAAANLSAVFADAGSHDTHNVAGTSIAWGDTTSSTPTVNEPGHTVSSSHVYASPGTYNVTVTVNDDDGGTVSDSSKYITVQGPPTAGSGGPYFGNEGSTIPLSGTATGTPPLTKSWTFTPGPADPGTNCTYTGTATLTPTVNCNDDLVVGAQLSVSDGVNPPVVSSTNVTVDNEAPVLNPLTATAGPIVVGTLVTVNGAFTDAGTNDTHTSTADWGDMSSSAGLVSESSGSGTTAATHTYLVPGLYTVSVDVNDGDGGIATRTIQIRVNTPPTADAGGPYAGPEGTLLTLGGTATDPDPDVLTTNWTFVVTGAPPSACTFGAVNTLAPTVLCTDNASVAATLAVSDGVNAPVLSVATLTVGNVAPSLGSLSVTASPVGVGSTVNASVPFSDAGSSDTHTGIISWGDGTTPATISESLGAGTASGTHVYALPGTYSVSITVTDDDGDSSTTTGSVVVVNSPPTANAGGPYTVNEGSSLTLAGTASDPEMDPLTISWSFAVAGNPGTVCLTSNTSTLTPTISCNDDALVVATLTVSDGINAPVSSVATITVDNVSPVLGPVAFSPMSVAAGGTVSLTVAFTDGGANDTYPIALVTWGTAQGASVPVVTASGGSGTLTASHLYTASGTFTVKVTLGDDDAGVAQTLTTITVT
jgi:hypothetical protein